MSIEFGNSANSGYYAKVEVSKEGEFIVDNNKVKKDSPLGKKIKKSLDKINFKGGETIERMEIRGKKAIEQFKELGSTQKKAGNVFDRITKGTEGSEQKPEVRIEDETQKERNLGDKSVGSWKFSQLKELLKGEKPGTYVIFNDYENDDKLKIAVQVRYGNDNYDEDLVLQREVVATAQELPEIPVSMGLDAKSSKAEKFGKELKNVGNKLERALSKISTDDRKAALKSKGAGAYMVIGETIASRAKNVPEGEKFPVTILLNSGEKVDSLPLIFKDAKNCKHEKGRTFRSINMTIQMYVKGKNVELKELTDKDVL